MFLLLSQFYETRISLMKEEDRNRRLFVENFSLENEIIKLKEREEKFEKDAIDKV